MSLHPSPAVKKPATAGEEHPPPAVNAPTVKEPVTTREEHSSLAVNSPTVKKPVAIGDPSPSVNAPTMKEPVAAGDGHPAMKNQRRPLGRSQKRSIPLEQRSDMRSKVPLLATPIHGEEPSLTLETISRLGEKKPPPFPHLNYRSQKL
ncbi:hypothetical protein B296_00003084 [Ensete ventricosum]|uniref:Uncharacterized protein n=1 Tax=Ensete ventricosum TaxID=4639 RepID=A0A426Y450_ENSVE|nr:hypothetical protein B296_00003084 [Ensete ventricosum]